jgi:hypothetical protein
MGDFGVFDQMTREDFLRQIERLKVRFGAKNFDSEMVNLVGGYVSKIPAPYLAKAVDNWIGQRKPSDPPLKNDFWEVKNAYERSQEKKEQVKKEFSYGLNDVVRRQYKVETLMEAYELMKLKIKLGEKV